MNNIILTVVLITAFFMCILSFIWGCRVGKQLGNSQVPKVNLNPIQPIVQSIETHKSNKEQAKLSDELTDIMGATRESMLKAIAEKRD